MKTSTKTSIRQYRPSDRADLTRCLMGLHDYIVKIDPQKRTCHGVGLDEFYTRKILGDVKRTKGAIFMAEAEGRVVGAIVGTLGRSSKNDGFAGIPIKFGNIPDLFVEPGYRSSGIGLKLMTRMETFFRSRRCDACYLDVFSSNRGAHRFYLRIGYQDRVLLMTKRLRKDRLKG